jgi:hypothetical protein
MKRWLAIPLAAIAAGVLAVSLSGETTTEAGTNPWTVSVDCNASTGAIDAPPCAYAAGTTPITVAVVLTNNSGASDNLGTFNFTLVHPDDGLLDAPNNPDPFEGNPNFQVSPTTDWACSPPAPDDDLNPGSPGEETLLSCFNALGSGVAIADGASLVLATVTYNVTGTGVETLTLQDVSVANALFVEIHSCNPEITPGTCVNSSVQIGASAATNTPTNTPTSTFTPAATNTPCVGAACPTATPLTFVTVTPTPAPATATPPGGGGEPTAPPPAGGTPGAPGAPTVPGGTTGGGGQGPITLPDTGTGSAATGDAPSQLFILAMSVVAVTLLGGAMARTAAAASRRGED